MNYPYKKTIHSSLATPEVELKAPFNFVPLANRVFTPDWAELISQDIPFSDGISGTISFDLVARTPVFVRNTQMGKSLDSSFCQMPDGTFFLPATSIKGEISEVLRIMSFGKIGRVANKAFGKRDLNNTSYTSKMKDVHCGWMIMTKEGVSINDCDIPGRISLEQIDRHYGTHLSEYVRDRGNLKRDENRTAWKKYQMMPEGRSLEANFISDKTLADRMRAQNPVDKRDFVTFAPKGEGDAGTIVFTGQPDVRQQRPNGRWTGKFFEFVFFEYEEDSILKVSGTKFKEFEAIYASSPDYEQFWKDKLYRGEKIPVFFTTNPDGSIHSIGLSYLHKYPYRKTIWDAIPKDHLDETTQDLNESIFGHVKRTALKGRVSFSHAKAVGSPHPLPIVTLRLSQPRPSYYPMYVEEGKNWDDATLISGFKRYPIRLTKPLDTPKGTKDMESHASMLPKGTVFRENVRFHNLRPAELGALLSAITFHGNQDRCFHSIGFGKPLGYGAMHISNIVLNGRTMKGDHVEDINEFMGCYEKMMIQFLPSWLRSDQMKELVLMAQGIPAGKERTFKYMELQSIQNGIRINEFAKIRGRDHLKPFSQRIGKESYQVPSIINNR